MMANKSRLAGGAVVLSIAIGSGRARAAPPEPLSTSGAETAPLSTSGTEVGPAQAAGPAPVAADQALLPNQDEEGRARLRDLEARLAISEAKLASLEKADGFWRHFKVQGFAQLQYRYEWANLAASPNTANGVVPPGIGANDVIAKADGTTTNTNLFRLRRTRITTIHETDVSRVLLQVDLFPAAGPLSTTQQSIARNIEVTGIARFSDEVRTEFTGGLFMVPYRQELVELSMTRPFLERSWASSNLFPTERDIGVHARTLVHDGRYVFDVGVVNGTRLGERTITLLPDVNPAKDGFAMVQGTFGPVTVSLHGYAGTGAVVDAQRLRVQNYRRWGVNVGATFAKTLFASLGETRVTAEGLIAENMDTGVNYPFALPEIPLSATDPRNLREQAIVVRAEQELTQWAIAGVRFDTYTPDVALPDDTRNTYLVMAGARFSKLLRLMNELSYAVDDVHAPGAPASGKQIVGYSAWLQGSFY